MSAYGEFKKRNVVYCTYLFAGEHGVVDFDETRIYLNALKDFDILEKEANEDVFGEGIYRVLLIKDFYDERGKLIKSELLKRSVIDRGDEL